MTVSGALGHSTVSTTLNVYAHVFQTAQARVAQAMDGAFSFLPQDTTTYYENKKVKASVQDACLYHELAQTLQS